MEVTLTGVCHCPRQIISSTARYTHLTASANLPPQDERPAVEVACMCLRPHATVYARIMHLYRYTPSSHHHRVVRDGRTLYIFSFNALTPRSARRPCFYASPSSSPLVIEPRASTGVRERSYNLSAAIGNFLIKFRIADRNEGNGLYRSSPRRREKKIFRAAHLFSRR